jgi:hypothetical protein
MWGTNAGRWYTLPLRIKPDLGQRPKDGVKPIKQVWAVFQDNVARSKLANEAGILKPQTAALAIKSKPRPARRKVLAGEAARNDINGNSIGSKSVCAKLSHVSIAGDVGPMLCKDTAGKLLYFAKGNGLKTACAFKAKAKAADAAKKIKDAQHLDCAGSERGNGDDQDNASQSGFRHGVKVAHVLPDVRRGHVGIRQRRQAVIIGWGHAASPCSASISRSAASTRVTLASVIPFLPFFQLQKLAG